MTKGQEALFDIKWYHIDSDGTLERREIIEKELQKPQELYNLIKQKRDNAMNDLNNQLHNIVEQIKLKGQIAAYHDILCLMESMFEVENG